MTIRCIPLMFEVITQVSEARKARGLGFSLRSFAVPVIVGTLMTADAMGEALAARAPTTEISNRVHRSGARTDQLYLRVMSSTSPMASASAESRSAAACSAESSRLNPTSAEGL